MIFTKVPGWNAVATSYKDLGMDYFNWLTKQTGDYTGRQRVIIAGSRTFNDYGLLKKKMERFTFYFENPIIITGGNKHWDPGEGRYVGADLLGEKWAHRKKFLVMTFHPEYDKYIAKAAPVIRNTEMVKFASKGPGGGYLAAFWNGESSGTRDVIRKARKANLKVKIVRF